MAILGIVLGAVGLTYSFKGVALVDLISRISGLRTWPFWLSQFFFLGSVLLRAVRWQLLLVDLTRQPLGPVFGATAVGMMANNFLPARMGEVPRATLLANRAGISSSAVLANIVAERIVDVASLPLLASCVWIFGTNRERSAVVSPAGWFVLVAILGSVGGLAILRRFEMQTVRLSQTFISKLSAKWTDRATTIVKEFLRGLNVFHGWVQCTTVMALSILIWLFGAASFFYLALSFSLQLGFADATLVFLIVILGITLPSTPGFVGTFHGFCVAALALVGVKNPTTAMAYATVVHGTGWLTVNTLGLIALFAAGRENRTGLFQSRRGQSL